MDTVRVVEYWETQARFILSHETTERLLERYRKTEEILLKCQIAQELVSRGENLRMAGRREEAMSLSHEVATLLKNENIGSLRRCRSDALYNLSTAFAALYHETRDNRYLEQAMKSIKESIALGNRTFNYTCILVLQNDKELAFEELRGCLDRQEVKWEDVEKDEEWNLLSDDPQYKELKRRWDNGS